MEFILLAPLLLMALVGTFLVRGHLAKHRLELTPSKDESEAISLYDLIKKQVSASPHGLLDDKNFPLLPGETGSGIRFAPGLRDVFWGAGRTKSKEWRTVQKTISAINQGRVTDWRIAEDNVKEVAAASCIDTLFEHLTTADITPAVKQAFWEVARRSREYEAVKWGIAIGSLLLQQAEVPDLLLLARHSEFTVFAVHGLMREAQKNPSLKGELVHLLPVTRGWGIIRLIDFITGDRSLLADNAVQHDILVYGMENIDGIEMEIAFTIAKNIDLARHFTQSVNDDRLFHASVDLMSALMLEPRPLGGLIELENWEDTYDAYLALLEQRQADIVLLDALVDLEVFLDDSDLKWQRKATELERVKGLWTSRYNDDILRDAFGDNDGGKERWKICRLVEKKSLKNLLPEIEEAFRNEPDYATISTLKAIGDKPQLQLLFEGIPNLTDLEARRKIAFRDKNSFDPEHTANYNYSQIVGSLGRLGTREAVEHIKMALEDYDPKVRSEAAKALLDLPLEMIDEYVG